MDLSVSPEREPFISKVDNFVKSGNFHKLSHPGRVILQLALKALENNSKDLWAMGSTLKHIEVAEGKGHSLGQVSKLFKDFFGIDPEKKEIIKKLASLRSTPPPQKEVAEERTAIRDLLKSTSSPLPEHLIGPALKELREMGAELLSLSHEKRMPALEKFNTLCDKLRSSLEQNRSEPIRAAFYSILQTINAEVLEKEITLRFNEGGDKLPLGITVSQRREEINNMKADAQYWKEISQRKPPETK